VTIKRSITLAIILNNKRLTTNIDLCSSASKNLVVKFLLLYLLLGTYDKQITEIMTSNGSMQYLLHSFNIVLLTSLDLSPLSRQAGHRFGEHLEKIMPHIIKFCRLEDDELREYCLQAFESFVRRCPKEISPFVADVSLFQYIIPYINLYLLCVY